MIDALNAFLPAWPEVVIAFVVVVGYDLVKAYLRRRR